MAGFDCDFAEDVTRGVQAKCPICLLVLREPYQATCCGKSFCRTCIQKVKAISKHCPMCKETHYNLFHDKGLQQALYDFHVHCSHKSKGCDWTGELRELEIHLNSDPSADKSLEGCSFTVIDCPFGCKVELSRQDLVTGSHLSTCSILCGKNLQRCVLKKEAPSPWQQNEGQYDNYLIDIDEYCSALQHVSPIDITMTGFEQHRKEDDKWYSPPFYTHPSGYKMCLEVYTNGWAEGKGTHISVYVHLMRGEFDDHLKWPFRGDIFIQLHGGQQGESKPYTRKIPFNDTTRDSTAGRVLSGDLAETGRGFCKFAPHAAIRAQYLRHDSLIIHIR